MASINSYLRCTDKDMHCIESAIHRTDHLYRSVARERLLGNSLIEPVLSSPSELLLDANGFGLGLVEKSSNKDRAI